MASTSSNLWNSDIDYDIRKKLNAKLEGNQCKTFLLTNPRPTRTPDFKNHSRTFNLPHEYILNPYRFGNSIMIDAIADVKVGYHHKEPIITHEKMRISQQQLVKDYINRKNNMYNDLEPFRSALKLNETIIPASSYLRGLLSEPKPTVTPGIVPIDPIVASSRPIPSAPPSSPRIMTRSHTRALRAVRSLSPPLARPQTTQIGNPITELPKDDAEKLKRFVKDKAATKIQGLVKGVRVRKKIGEFVDATTKIQGAVRQFQARKKIVKESKSRKEQAEAIVDNIKNDAIAREVERQKASKDDEPKYISQPDLIEALGKHGIDEYSINLLNLESKSAKDKYPILLEIASYLHTFGLEEQFTSIVSGSDNPNSKTGKYPITTVKELNRVLEFYKSKTPSKPSSSRKKSK